MATAVDRLSVDTAVERADAFYRLPHFVLDPEDTGVKGTDIAKAVLDSDLTLTIEGASTLELTLQDENLTLLRSDLLVGWAWGKNADNRDEKHWMLDGRKVDAKLDDVWFRLVNVEKLSFDQVKLTFEDREVAKLRAFSGAKKVYRQGGVTRAAFVKQLCDQADVPIYIPELHTRQPVAKAATPTASQRRTQGKMGLNRSAGITVKGHKATAEQLRNIQIALDVGTGLNAPELALLAALCAGTGESEFKSIPNRGGSNYTGVFQGSKNIFKASDTQAEAHYFFAGGKGYQQGGAIHQARSNPHQSPGAIALAVEASGAGVSFYQQHAAEARKTLAAYQPGISSSGQQTVTAQKPFAFARGKQETSWDAIQRLAEEVQWRAFVRKGVLWYVSEEWLFNQQPQIHTEEREPDKPDRTAVDEITFSIDLGARDLVAEMSVKAHAARWTALPGMVATVGGQGPADGRWLVHAIERPLWDDLATVTLNKPLPAKPEPAADTQTFTFATGSPNLGGPAAGPVGQVLGKAIEISKRNLPYRWGGGHNSSFSPSAGGGYDCSGYVCACLHAAGLIGSPQTSGGLTSWGQPGKGKLFTVWANNGHTFIQFHVGRYTYADTSRQAGGPSGPHVRTGHRSTGGFVARHARGL